MGGGRGSLVYVRKLDPSTVIRRLVQGIKGAGLDPDTGILDVVPLFIMEI
jgi:hypothetical protein